MKKLIFIIFIITIITLSAFAYLPLNIREAYIGKQFDAQIELFYKHVTSSPGENAIGFDGKLALNELLEITFDVPYSFLFNQKNYIGDLSYGLLINFIGK